MSVEIGIAGLDDVIKGLEKSETNMAKAVNATCGDFKKRAPSWIEKAVREEYTIGKGEVKEAYRRSYNIGKSSLGGVTLDNVILEFSGKLLTPIHFKMSPQQPKTDTYKNRRLIPGYYTSANRAAVWSNIIKSSKINVTIKKGQKKRLSPDSGWEGPFLAAMGNSPVIPFQRRPRTSYGAKEKIKSIRTLSVPQMITNEKVSEDINKRIEEDLGKRLQHHINRFNN